MERHWVYTQGRDIKLTCIGQWLFKGEKRKMKVKALSSVHCMKCQQAKLKLEGLPVEWHDIEYSPEPLKWIQLYDIDKTPAFLIFNDDEKYIRITYNVLEVRDLLRHAKD